ncbi:hypothetical protein RhiirA4_425290 [Rhizophagus irregularis]|uniref:Uncharacterized protein n=1 Tax=Rhizophagus irregularis TaxID=588596 RepID=A0A2I1H0Q3_9GLOM|nr:hypothetical protein RhiirA4_425290 [Rhizophagus irregularis]
MASSLSVDSNPQARKDGKRLKEINLVDEEWEALKKLTNILKKFAEATDLLEESVNIVLTTLDIVFDEDVKYVDSPEDEINTSHPKERKIYIETPQDCKDLKKMSKMLCIKL